MSNQSELKINGKPYQLLVLLLKSRDEKGRPKAAVIFHDDEKVNPQGGEEFMIVFAPSGMLGAKD